MSQDTEFYRARVQRTHEAGDGQMLVAWKILGKYASL